MLYDGVHFPIFPNPFDLILSVGVLQIYGGELLKKTISTLAQYLKKDGNLCLIEQASDNPKMDRPKVKEYLQALKNQNSNVSSITPFEMVAGGCFISSGMG